MNGKRILIDPEFDEFLEKEKERTGMPKIRLSKWIARVMKSASDCLELPLDLNIDIKKCRIKKCPI